MSDLHYLLAVILVMALMTFLTRVLPFVAFRNNKDHHLLDYLGRYMPPVIMTILVVYSLQGVDISIPPYGVREFIAVLLTALVHWLWSNALLSIFSGTALYVFLVQSGLLL
ncbi:MAG: branched-chain amino acid ABC transporter [Sedimenticola sp.]|nr:MAG: branched-chain amino acid ABC transporter [Sedimenticola sp.]